MKESFLILACAAGMLGAPPIMAKDSSVASAPLASEVRQDGDEPSEGRKYAAAVKDGLVQAGQQAPRMILSHLVYAALMQGWQWCSGGRFAEHSAPTMEYLLQNFLTPKILGRTLGLDLLSAWGRKYLGRVPSDALSFVVISGILWKRLTPQERKLSWAKDVFFFVASGIAADHITGREDPAFPRSRYESARFLGAVLGKQVTSMFGLALSQGIQSRLFPKAVGA